METCVRVPASSSNNHEKEDDSNEPRRFHRHVQGGHAKRVVESYPPLYRPSENGHKLPRLLRKPLEARCIVYDLAFDGEKTPFTSKGNSGL